MKRAKDSGNSGRRCQLTKRLDFDGYGFVLRSKKERVGHYIGAIEDSSPAQRAGVHVGDRVLSVNGRCIRHSYNHKQVVELINELPGQVELLLVDAATNAISLNDDKVQKGRKAATIGSHQDGQQQLRSDNTDFTGSTEQDRGQFVTLGADEPAVGVTSLDDKLYVLIGRHDVRLLVFDVTPEYPECRRLAVSGVGRPIDLASCCRYRCLYISDCENNWVHRVAVIDVMMTSSTSDENQLKSTKWPVGATPCGISVTPSTGRVLVTCTNSRLVKQFTGDGQLLHEVDVGVSRPFQAVRLATGQLLVCHGGAADSTHGVSIVDEKSGKLVITYGGKRGVEADRLNSPWHLAVDDRSTGIRMVYVADFNNERIVKMRLTNGADKLTHVSDVVSRGRQTGWLWMPFRLHLDAGRRLLYVAENRLNTAYELSETRIAVVRL